MLAQSPSKSTQLRGPALSLTNILTGAQQFLGSKTLLLPGGPASQSQIVQQVNNLLAPYKAVGLAHQGLSQSVSQVKDQMDDVKSFIQQVQAAVVAAFGPSGPEYAGFGFKAPKARTPLTTEQQAAKVAKMRATRAARHTLGSKQRKAVTGSVAPAASTSSPSGTTSQGGSVSPSPASGANSPTTSTGSSKP
jgi:hypothetical protein